MENDGKSLQNVGGLSFRKLAETIEEGDVPDDVLSFADDSDNPNILKSFLFKIYNWLNKRSGKGLSPASFLVDLIVYLGVRTRVIMVLLGVTTEVISSLTDNLKRKVIKNMFWGRGYLFKLSVQFVSVIVLVVIASSYFYRSPSVSAQFVAATQAPATDTITIKGSTSTERNGSSGFSEPTTYIVKVGDTVSGIAQTNGISSDTIRWANGLEEYEIIKPGQELKIPPGDGVLVKVKKGDTVEKLAKKYHSSPQLIIGQNLLFPPDYDLTTGDNLFIPDGRIEETPKVTTPVYSGVIATTPNLYLPSSSITSGVGRFVGWPVAGGRGRVTQCYSVWHNGVDIADSGYPDLVAAASGTVTFAGCQSGSCPVSGSQVGGWGLAWAVVIDHGNGLSTVYGHMNQIYVRRGQYVSAGQSIGQMGRSGTAYGTHVHFMVLSGGSWSGINPAPYMKAHVCGY